MSIIHFNANISISYQVPTHGVNNQCHMFVIEKNK